MSVFRNVVDFNRVCGVIPSDEPTPSLSLLKTPAFLNAWKLVVEEFNETAAAVGKIMETDQPTEEMYKELVDGLIDMEYVILGMGCRMGVDMDLAHNLVHTNNMSKICQSEQEAQLTVEKYLNSPGLGYLSPTYRTVEGPWGETLWVVYNKDTAKVLKSVSWKEVDLTPAVTPYPQSIPE